ncbi:MAG: triphosphoribosyl-dephospho-CoA synthase [Rhizobacter sp.]|nr:triphosphoribosyl-dephospho-CoA synthase [Rhizobacter sp.]
MKPLAALSAAGHARAAYLRACELDVMVRKPGNVSLASRGHGMDAAQFLASAQASSGPLFTAGTQVGARIEGAVQASLAVAGCNTNLGIVLLCAPLALATLQWPNARAPAQFRDAVEHVLSGLDIVDAQAAFRAIARANPGGLGSAEQQDVHHGASVDLRAAMALAAGRDRIALQYVESYREVFSIGIGELPVERGAGRAALPDAATAQAVQTCYLRWLSTAPDSHIVRKHGLPVAAEVMQSAQAWHRRALAGERLDLDPAWSQWDVELKARGINPGTSADLTVASLMLSRLLGVI